MNWQSHTTRTDNTTTVQITTPSPLVLVHLHTDFNRFFGELQEWAKKTIDSPHRQQGIKSAWDLRNKLPRRHRITLIFDKPETIIRASFPRVVFEGIPLEELALDLARNFKGTGIPFIHDRLVKID